MAARAERAQEVTEATPAAVDSDAATALREAAEAVSALGRHAILEIRGLRKPPVEVASVSIACSLLLTGGHPPAHGWHGAVKLMGNPLKFLARLRAFDATGIDENTLELVEDVISLPFFHYKGLLSKSVGAACLAEWVLCCVRCHKAQLRARCRTHAAQAAPQSVAKPAVQPPSDERRAASQHARPEAPPASGLCQLLCHDLLRAEAAAEGPPSISDYARRLVGASDQDVSATLNGLPKEERLKLADALAKAQLRS